MQKILNMKIKITEAQLRALKDFAGGKDDFEILYKKVLYRVKNGMPIYKALSSLGITSQKERHNFYDKLSPEQRNELRLERAAFSYGTTVDPSVRDIHRGVGDFFKTSSDSDDDLMEEGVFEIASEVPEVVKIIVNMIIHRKIDNVIGLYDAISKGDAKTAVQILTIGPDIREEDKVKLKTFFNNSESRKYMVQLKNELLKNPYTKKAIEYAKKGVDYLKTAKEKISSVVSEDVENKSHMSLDVLMKSVVTMLDWGWSVKDIHNIIDHIHEVHGKSKSEKISESDEKIKIKTQPIEAELNRRFKDKVIEVQMDSATPMKVKVEYVTPIFNYVGGAPILRKTPMESFIDFTFFDGKEERSLVVDVVLENNKLIAKPEIYVVSNPNAQKIDRSVKGKNDRVINTINQVISKVRIK